MARYSGPRPWDYEGYRGTHGRPGEWVSIGTMLLLRSVMLTDLDRAYGIAHDGHEVVPTWHILTPEGAFLIVTRFDQDKPQQRERVLSLVPRFMAWKLAIAFVLTAETWLGPERTRSGEEALLAIGVSQHERLGVIRRLRRTPTLALEPPEWLTADAIDERYFTLLPSGASTVTAEDAAMLAAVFDEDGELPALAVTATRESKTDH
jgi:hypothetical protein